MTNADDPASPITIRARMAMEITARAISSSDILESAMTQALKKGTTFSEHLAEWSVMLADALIAAINEQKD